MNWRGTIVGGIVGAAVGGTLGIAVDSQGALEGTVIGSLVGFCGTFFMLSKLRRTKGQMRAAFPKDYEVDLYLNANRLIKKYIQGKVSEGLKIEGNLHFLSNDEFEQLCFNYLLNDLAKGLKLPSTKTPIKASNLYDQARETAKRSHGFQISYRIYINKYTAEAGTVIHESIHFFQDISYYDKVRSNANEGTTEYFTRLICDEHQITRSQKYPLQYECIKKLVLICSEDKLAEAYFQGNIYALERVVDASKGQGTFQMWIYSMDDGDFDNANFILR
jgi:hypothetical protein